MIYDVQISRIKKKHYVQGQKPSIKCAYRERESKLMVMRTHMVYLFPIENEIVLLSQRCTQFILSSEFWISIHNVANCPTLEKYENQTIRICLYNSYFFAKWSSVVLRVFNLFQIEESHPRFKFVLNERNMDEMITRSKDKSNNPFISFFKPCRTLIWNFSPFLRTSKSCEKYRAKNVWKFLSALDALGRGDLNWWWCVL